MVILTRRPGLLHYRQCFPMTSHCNEKRYSFEITQMYTVYDHENETMRGQRILNKLISNYMDYFSLKPKVREGVAELSKSVHKLLLDIAHSDRHCNFTDAMEKIPGTGSPDQSESLQVKQMSPY